MKQIIFGAVLIFAFCLAAFAQVNKNICPKIRLSLPDKFLIPEETVTFFAKVGEEQEIFKVEYFWMISGGKIISGQGTSGIKFAPSEEYQSMSIGVAVKIIGLPNNCSDTVSEFISVAPEIIGEPVAEFGKVDLNHRKAHFDSLVVSVIQVPDSEGLIILQFDKKDSRNYKISLLKNIIKIFESRRYDKTRITFAISEGDYEETELWVVPQGAKFPKSHTKDYKRISEENNKIIKAEELKQKIGDLCLSN